MTLKRELQEALARNEKFGEEGLGIVLVGRYLTITGWPRGERVGWSGVNAPTNAWAYTVKQVRTMIQLLEKIEMEVE